MARKRNKTSSFPKFLVRLIPITQKYRGSHPDCPIVQFWFWSSSSMFKSWTERNRLLYFISHQISQCNRDLGHYFFSKKKELSTFWNGDCVDAKPICQIATLLTFFSMITDILIYTPGSAAISWIVVHGYGSTTYFKVNDRVPFTTCFIFAILFTWKLFKLTFNYAFNRRPSSKCMFNILNRFREVLPSSNYNKK